MVLLRPVMWVSLCVDSNPMTCSVFNDGVADVVSFADGRVHSGCHLQTGALYTGVLTAVLLLCDHGATA
jgi:hypothetical protein